MARTYLGHTQIAANADLDALAAGTAAGWIQSGAGAVERTVSAKLRERVSLADFGAVGDGIINDAVAIRAALVATAARKATLVFEPAKTYFVGNYSDEDRVFEFTGLTDVSIDGQGSEILINTTAVALPAVFYLIDPLRVSFHNLRFRDGTSDITVDWQGAYGILVEPNTALPDGTCGGIILDNCHADAMVALMIVANSTNLPDTDRRVRDIAVRDCTVTDCYYGCGFWENGDCVTISGLHATNTRRPYYPFGVQSHDVAVTVFHDGVSPAGSNACIPIKRYVRDTRGIKVRVVFSGSVASYSTAINFEHGPTATTGSIEGIDAQVVFAGAVDVAATMWPYRFRSFDTNGTLEPTTANEWKSITLGGHAVGRGLTQGRITIESAPTTTECDVTLSPDIGRPVDLSNFVSGYVFRLSASTEMRVKSGDLTASPIVIPMDAFNATTFMLRVKVWATADRFGLSAAKTTYEEALLLGYNASAGALVIQQSAVVDSQSQSTAATIAYTAVGENLEVSFVGADYANTNSRARVTVEYLSNLNN